MRKSKLILMQLFIAIVLVCTSVYASVSAGLALDVDKTTVDKGDTITVVLSLKDVDTSKKIESIEGYINYNKNIIEPLTVNSIKKDANNTVNIANQVLKVEDLTNATINDVPSTSSYVAFNGAPTSDNDVKIIIDFNDGISANSDLLSIEFKVKEDATAGEIKNAISYSMFVITEDSVQSEEITKNVNVTVKAPVSENQTLGGDTNNTNTDDKSNNTNTNTNTNKNTNTNTNTNKNVNTNTNSNTNKAGNTNTNASNTKNNAVATSNKVDNTLSGTKLPATGAEMVLIPAVVIAILAYVSYNRYIKYKDI